MLSNIIKERYKKTLLYINSDFYNVNYDPWDPDKMMYGEGEIKYNFKLMSVDIYSFVYL